MFICEEVIVVDLFGVVVVIVVFVVACGSAGGGVWTGLVKRKMSGK